MISRHVLLFSILIVLLTLPVQAHVPVSVSDNSTINSAFVIDNPLKTYVFYGKLHEAGDVAYYRLDLDTGDQLSVSLMNTGLNNSVPDMVILVPDPSLQGERIPKNVIVPGGYTGTIIRGTKPAGAEYEPFGPAGIFTVARYSQRVLLPGAYYIAVISPSDDMAYSIATGDREEFSAAEWVMVPLNGISTRLWEGQSIPDLLAPFLAVMVIGAFMVMRRERKNGSRPDPAFWLATVAGLCYLGGASITFVQMVRALAMTGFSPAAGVTLIFVLIPVILGIAALRVARAPVPRSLANRVIIAAIGGLGLLFWAGFIIGPLMAMLAALVPDAAPGSPQEP
jgi:hypothetical protein